MDQFLDDLITGKLLGDGSLEDRSLANSRLQIRHSIKQKEYVDWCYMHLKEFAVSKPKQNRFSYYFRSKSLPMFTKLRKIWYVNGKKILPLHIKFTPLVISIWYMDDGYYDRTRDSVWLCTHNFDLLEIERLRVALASFDINSGKVRDRTHYKIRISSKDTCKFIELVRPHILPSLLYKIGIAP
ncbi:hypothetical protein A2576_00175 [Candidatus Amesbacteria bacterium RIFOXYD1_FULL_47_9]|uniref:LAGLIDADG homing endonuclease n=2 Tax=Candidatus Amesiibacteriota TaxID=1752730 RepID=A0A0G1XJ68_9BACT|nr:MAG: LAGLIDADG homing endonuclease [Candidatus Amesbacteria bacterium GW2011_GWC1_48_10]OGD12465.1 MAG: hypothetical protein A2576_00175 [Candidatus Amesbacteria bacterium RIFOXYD1_FULL_47_9]